MIIIGITGAARSGKDTLANALVENHGFTRYAFADGVRESALAINPLIEFGGENVRLSDLVDELGWEDAKADGEVRALLQHIGTEAMRDVAGPDVWVNALANKITASNDERIVITDVRFANELAFIKNQGGVVIKMLREEDNGLGENSQHPSEQPLEGADAQFLNNGSLESVAGFADEVVFGILFSRLAIKASTQLPLTAGGNLFSVFGFATRTTAKAAIEYVNAQEVALDQVIEHGLVAQEITEGADFEPIEADVLAEAAEAARLAESLESLAIDLGQIEAAMSDDVIEPAAA